MVGSTARGGLPFSFLPLDGCRQDHDWLRRFQRVPFPPMVASFHFSFRQQRRASWTGFSFFISGCWYHRSCLTLFLFTRHAHMVRDGRLLLTANGMHILH